MSKINARSPFYINYSTPTAPTVAFDCTVANLTGFAVDQEGIVTEPNVERGVFKSFTSSAGDFANGKFATVSTDTSRTISVVIEIPTGYSNSSSGTLTCTATATQIAKVTSGSTPSCTGGPTTNGTISTQTIASGGNTATIDLTTKFNSATKYAVVNHDPALFNAVVSGTNLILTSGNSGGSGNAYVRANDNGVNTCTAIQRVPVTITVSSALDCTTADLTGGSATAAGVVTEPTLIGGTIASFATDSSGSPTLSTIPENTGSAAQNVTVYFNITVGAEYSNSGATIVCPKVISQAGTGLPTFTCDIAGLSGQGVSRGGDVIVGTAAVGTITDYTIVGSTDKKFNEVSSAVTRNISFEVTPPAGEYSSDSAITCPNSSGLPITQLPATTTCGTIIYYGNDRGEVDETDFCQSGEAYAREFKVLSTATNIRQAKGHSVCYADQSTNAAQGVFQGGDLYYVVDTFLNLTDITQRALSSTQFNSFLLWRVNNGIIQEVWEWNCSSGGDGSGNQIQ